MPTHHHPPAHDLGESAIPLDPDEQQRAVEEEALNAATTHEVIRREGKRELDRSAPGLAWSGLAAGLSMGLSPVAYAALLAALPDVPWRSLVASLGYSAGFLAVILGSQQLFTENTLTPIVPLLSERNGQLLGKVARLWAVVLVTNLVGGWLFALAITHAPVLPQDVMEALRDTAALAMAPSPLALFLRAILAGWLVALMVWMLPASGGSSVLTIIIMTWLIGVTHTPHVIVGAVEVSHLASAGIVSYGAALGHYVLPVLAGNIVGGVLLVSAVNHAQVTAAER